MVSNERGKHGKVGDAVSGNGVGDDSKVCGLCA